MSGSRTHAARIHDRQLHSHAVSVSPILQRSMQHLPARANRTRGMLSVKAPRARTVLARTDHAHMRAARDERDDRKIRGLRPQAGHSSAPSPCSTCSTCSTSASSHSMRSLDSLDIGKSSSHMRGRARTGVCVAWAGHQPHGVLSSLKALWVTLETRGTAHPANYRSSYVSGRAGTDSAQYMHHSFGARPKRRPPTERSLATVG